MASSLLPSRLPAFRLCHHFGPLTTYPYLGFSRKLSSNCLSLGRRTIYAKFNMCQKITARVKQQNCLCFENAFYGQRHFSVTLSSKMEVKSSVESKFDDLEYTRIYRFPYIVAARAFSRFKIYQTAVTSIFVPYVCYLYSIETVDLATVKATVGMATFACIMLYIISGFFRRLIGIISLSKDGTVVRIGHLTFWGNRKNFYAPVENIVPLMDLPDNPKDIYIHVRTFDSDKHLNLTLAFGGIDDIENFENVFGKLDGIKHAKK